ncbi:MAG TPA: nucleotide sugar dehydrogenase [Verrucomicrobiae bacterium]|nr:nucleotide sugar dehydrogenase [Verrucomicrobiae bacterium]
MDNPSLIGIVGLGYVGLPLALQFAKSNCRVLGFDTDNKKVGQLNRGRSYIFHIPAKQIAAAVKTGRFSATPAFRRIRECSAIIICVPTPLKKNHAPDLSYILNTGRAIAPHLAPGTLVVLESTTYPGTTDTELREVLEKHSGLRAGREFHLAFSPERVDPGNPDSDIAKIPKVVGGLTPGCLRQATKLYGRAIEKIVPVACCRVAEAVKLTENIFRAVNIAMVNELKVVFEAMGIDVWEVIAAAKTKPFGFMPFYPGPGLGGHCIPIDPFYLAWKAREYSQETRFIELAGRVNTAMPRYVVRRVTEALASVKKRPKASRVLLVGIAYKANVDDDRESPAYVIWDLLERAGAKVTFHDPHIRVIRPSRDHWQFAGRRGVALTARAIAAADVVVIVTRHEAVNYALIAKHARLVVDSRNALGKLLKGLKTYFKA